MEPIRAGRDPEDHIELSLPFLLGNGGWEINAQGYIASWGRAWGVMGSRCGL